MAVLTEIPLLGLATVANFPAPMLGNSVRSGTPFLCVTLGILKPVSHPGFCPTLLPEHPSGRDVCHRSKFLKVPILCSGIISFFDSWLTDVLSHISPQICLTIYPLRFTSPHLPYKSGHFSTCRIPAIIFLYLRLTS